MLSIEPQPITQLKVGNLDVRCLFDWAQNMEGWNGQQWVEMQSVTQKQYAERMEVPKTALAVAYALFKTSPTHLALGVIRGPYKLLTFSSCR